MPERDGARWPISFEAIVDEESGRDHDGLVTEFAQDFCHRFNIIGRQFTRAYSRNATGVTSN
jgi:hypothetical protein